jgi:hypothetical protein
MNCFLIIAMLKRLILRWRSGEPAGFRRGFAFMDGSLRDAAEIQRSARAPRRGAAVDGGVVS